MRQPLRIAQIAPIARAVTCASSGSIEQIVWLLADELVARGHSVTLFATGDSETSAELRAIYERGYDDDDELWDEWSSHELLHAAWALEQAADFDVVHSHAYHYALPFTRFASAAIVHTFHVLPEDVAVRALRLYPDAHVVSVSKYHRTELDGRRDAPVVHHGIDTDAFPFSSVPGDYLLFLGKLSYGKGPVEAIRVAQKAGMPLVVAGAGDEDDDYFREVVAPLLHAPGVEYVGWVHVQKRNELLAGAAALLYPLNVAEPFGLVMLEAMACGTPVLALDRGAVPEIVTNGVSGYHAPDLDSLVRSVPPVLALDRTRVREEAVARFDRRRMADEYEALYHRVGEPRRAGEE
jgi:glycosyltransferase involved in cell wall biosynthesis